MKIDSSASSFCNTADKPIFHIGATVIELCGSEMGVIFSDGKRLPFNAIFNSFHCNKVKIGVFTRPISAKVIIQTKI